MHLVAELLQLLLGLVVDAGARLRVGQLLPCRLLALVVCLALDFPPLLESGQTLASTDPYHHVHITRTYLATTSWYFQPNSWPRRPTVQYFRPGFNLSTRSACGTTILFLRS